MSYPNVLLSSLIETIESGSRPKGGSVKEGIPSLGAEHITRDGKITFDNPKFIPIEYYNSMKRGKVKVNDILIVKDGATTGKVGFIDDSFKNKELAINEHLFLIRPKPELHPKFLFYLLSSPFGQSRILKDFRGATVGGITVNFVNFEIPLPPLRIQELIAQVLDQAYSLVRKRRDSIDKLDQLTQSVFLEMFGDPVVNSKGWTVLKLNDLCQKITDGTHHSPENTPIGDYMYITAKNITKDGIDLTDVTYVTTEVHREIYSRCNPEFGDVLYIKDGATTGIATVNTLKEEFSLLSSVALLKPKKGLLEGHYLANVLNSRNFYRYIRNQMGGAGITRLTIQKIKEFKIPLPPIDLQNYFAEYVQHIQSQKQLMQQQLAKLEENFQSLMQRAFKGELFDDDPTHELERENRGDTLVV